MPTTYGASTTGEVSGQYTSSFLASLRRTLENTLQSADVLGKQQFSNNTLIDGWWIPLHKVLAVPSTNVRHLLPSRDSHGGYRRVIRNRQL